MPPLSVCYYRGEDGTQPVDDFVEALDGQDRQATFDMQVGRLRDLTTQNPRLAEPYTQPVDDEMWALNLSIEEAGSTQRYRVIYAIYGHYCVVLHAYLLAGADVGAAQAVARARRKDFLHRIDGDGLSPLGSPIA